MQKAPIRQNCGQCRVPLENGFQLSIDTDRINNNFTKLYNKYSKIDSKLQQISDIYYKEDTRYREDFDHVLLLTNKEHNDIYLKLLKSNEI